MIFRLSFILILLGGQSALGQSTVLSLTDESPSGSPISISGTGTILQDSPRQYAFHLSVSNRSEKDILLRILKLDIVRPGDQDSRTVSRQDDYFFGPTVFEAHSSDAVEIPDHNSQNEPPASAIIANVEFVQFTDGTTWGEMDQGKGVLTSRQHIWDRLLALTDTYQTKGQESFMSQLKQEQKSDDVGVQTALRGSYQGNGSSEAAIQKIRTMLRDAEAHLKMMRNPKLTAASR